MNETETIQLRPACLNDVPAMQQLIADYAQESQMLPRTRSELYETVRDFIIAEQRTEKNEHILLGCGALHICTKNIAEVKSLAVARKAQGLGVGRRLVDACCRMAQEIGLEKVFCLTYQERFFQKLGFVTIDRALLPEKVWGECVRCNKFLECDEIAMWKTVKTVAPAQKTEEENK